MAFLKSVLDLLKVKNIQTVYADFVETAKNRSNSGFYSQFGFTVMEEDEKTVHYSLETRQPLNKINHIQILSEWSGH